MSSKSTVDETTIISSSASSLRERMLAASAEPDHEPATTHIGKSCFLKGNVAAREDVYINGSVEGTIAIKNNRLEIGCDGRIEANVFGRIVKIDGELRGDIYASEQAIITKTGRVYGNIFSPDVNIEDGAMLKGNIDMEKQDLAHHPLIPDFHEDEHRKSASFGALFKRMRDKYHPEATITSIETSACRTSIEEILHLASEANIVHDASSDISIIGETIMIKGEIMAEENMVILGQIEGMIHFKNCNVLVGHNALIRSNVYAQSLITQGEISGDIYTSQKSIIKKPGHVSGNVHSPAVSIESGAILMGSIDMEPQDIENVYANAIRAASQSSHEKLSHQLSAPTGSAKQAITNAESTPLVDTSWPN